MSKSPEALQPYEMGKSFSPMKSVAWSIAVANQITEQFPNIKGKALDFIRRKLEDYDTMEREYLSQRAALVSIQSENRRLLDGLKAARFGVLHYRDMVIRMPAPEHSYTGQMLKTTLDEIENRLREIDNTLSPKHEGSTGGQHDA